MKFVTVMRTNPSFLLKPAHAWAPKNKIVALAFAAYSLPPSHLMLFITCSPLWEMVQEGIDLKTIKWTQH